MSTLKRIYHSFRNLRQKKLSIRLTIILFFLLLIGFVSFSSIAINQYVLNRVLIRFAKDMIQLTDLYVQDKTNAYLRPLNSESIRSIDAIKRNDITPGPSYVFTYYLYDMMKGFQNLDSVYWGTAQGNIYGIQKDTANTYLVEHLEHEGNKTFLYAGEIDAKGQLSLTKSLSTVKYDPRLRPWYIAAQQKKQTTWTSIHQFHRGVNNFNIDHEILGITSSTPIYDKAGNLRGVFGIDLASSALSSFIENIKLTKNSIIFIRDNNYNLVAASANMNARNYIGKQLTPAIWDALQIPRPVGGYAKLPTNVIVTFSYHNQEYFVVRQVLPYTTGNNWHETIIVPVNDVLGPLRWVVLITVILTIVVLLLGAFIARVISRKISQPITQLVQEAKTIQKLNLDGSFDVDTRIKEIHAITHAFKAMKSSLKSFQSYVPTTLVKKLLLSGKIARVGGEMKDITVLFCDIKSFTELSETIPAAKVVHYLSEYFEDMTKEILRNQGTVDKYIGDSIMAFWGAPIPDKDHALHACRCALEMMNALNVLNAKLYKEGFEGFAVRMGINSGSAIVGNVGSTERLNYTAIGDSVNLASRLESTNKLYGTTIIISDHTYALVKDNFSTRLLDQIAVRGRHEGTYIYELIADDQAMSKEELQAYNSTFAVAFAEYQAGRWDTAIILFNKLTETYPQDQLLWLLIDRCLFLKNKNPSDWDGIWRL